MATAKTIDQLDAAGTLSAQDRVALAQQTGTEAKKATLAQVAAAVADINEEGALSELTYATSQGKNAVAAALTAKGVPTTAGETLIQMADKVSGLNVDNGISDIYGISNETSSVLVSNHPSLYKYTIPGSLDMVIFLKSAKQILYVPYGDYETVDQILSSYSAMLQLETYSTQNAEPAFSHDGTKLLLIHDDLHEIYDISSTSIVLNKTVSITHEGSSYKNSNYCITDDAKYIAYTWREGSNVSGTVHLVLVNTVSGISSTYNPGWGSYYSNLYCKPMAIWEGCIYGGKLGSSNYSFTPFYLPFTDTETEISFGTVVVATNDLGAVIAGSSTGGRIELFLAMGKKPVFARIGSQKTVAGFPNVSSVSMYYYDWSAITSGESYKRVTIGFARKTNLDNSSADVYFGASAYEYTTSGDYYKIHFYDFPLRDIYIHHENGTNYADPDLYNTPVSIFGGDYIMGSEYYLRYPFFYYNKQKRLLIGSYNNASDSGLFFGTGSSPYTWSSLKYAISPTTKLFGKYIEHGGSNSGYATYVGTVTMSDLNAGRYDVQTQITPAVPDDTDPETPVDDNPGNGCYKWTVSGTYLTTQWTATLYTKKLPTATSYTDTSVMTPSYSDEACTTLAMPFIGGSISPLMWVGANEAYKAYDGKASYNATLSETIKEDTSGGDTPAAPSDQTLHKWKVTFMATIGKEGYTQGMPTATTSENVDAMTPIYTDEACTEPMYYLSGEKGRLYLYTPEDGVYKAWYANGDTTGTFNATLLS